MYPQNNSAGGGETCREDETGAQQPLCLRASERSPSLSGQAAGRSERPPPLAQTAQDQTDPSQRRARAQAFFLFRCCARTAIMLAGDLQTQIAGKPAESLARSPPEDGDSSDQTVPVQAKPASLAPGTPEEAVSGPNPPPRGPRLARKRKSEGPAHLVVLGGDEDAKKIRVVGDSAAARDQLKQRPEAAHVGLSVARSDSPKSGTNVSSDSTFAMVPKKEVTSQIEQMNRPHAARRLLGPSRLTGDRDEGCQLGDADGPGVRGPWRGRRG